MTGTRIQPQSRAIGLVLTGAVLLLGGCSGGSSPSADAAPTRSGSGAPPAAGGSTSPTSSSAERVTAQVLEDASASSPLASVKGNLTFLSDTFPAVAEVLEVRVGAKSTLLRWQLKSASGPRTGTRVSSLSKPPLFDTRAVSLRDAAGKQVLSPFTYTLQRNENDIGCVCSQVPTGLGADAEPMYALYPPLAPAATTVDVILPGFAVAKGVPVTRR